jgi:hypothetical protein
LDSDEEAADIVLDEEDAMETPVIRKGGGRRASKAADDEEAATLEDDPAAASEDLEPIGLDDSKTGHDDDEELEPIGLDDKPAAPRNGQANEDDLLDVLSGDDEAEVGAIDHDELLELDEDADEKQDVTLDDEKPKRRK